MPATSGSIMRPDSMGSAPCTICMYRGRVIIPPNMAIPTITPPAVTIAKVRSRNRRSGMRAWSPARASTMRNRPIPARPTR